MKERTFYIVPHTEIVRLNVKYPIQSDGYEVNGSLNNEEDEPWAKQNNFFVEEADDENYPKWRSPWDEE